MKTYLNTIISHRLYGRAAGCPGLLDDYFLRVELRRYGEEQRAARVVAHLAGGIDFSSGRRCDEEAAMGRDHVGYALDFELLIRSGVVVDDEGVTDTLWDRLIRVKVKGVGVGRDRS